MLQCIKKRVDRILPRKRKKKKAANAQNFEKKKKKNKRKGLTKLCFSAFTLLYIEIRLEQNLYTVP